MKMIVNRTKSQMNPKLINLTVLNSPPSGSHQSSIHQILKIKKIMPYSQQLIRLIMTYLQDHSLYRTLLSLELETQTSLDNITKEVQFLRSQILEGNYASAEQYLQPLKSRLGDQYGQVMLELKKQQYFELINSKPDVEVLIQLLKSIEQLTSPETYKNLCYFLTLSSIREHPDYVDWSIEKVQHQIIQEGRLDCFDRIATNLKTLGRTFKVEKYNSITLSQMFERFQTYQQTFNLRLEEEHEIMKENRSKVMKTAEDQLSKTSILLKETEDAEQSSQVNLKKKSQLYHSRVKSGELQNHENPSSQFYQSSKKSKAEQDKNIIIEKLHISDINHEEQDPEHSLLQISQQLKQPASSSANQSTLLNHKLEDMTQVAYLTDSHPIRGAVFSSDGEYFAIGTNSRSLKVYSMKSVINDGLNGELLPQYERPNHHQGSIYCIDWSRSGRFIATGSNDKIVKIFNYEDDSDITLQGHKGLIRTVCFSEETKLLSAGQDLHIKVWDVETSKCIRNLEGHTQAVYCVQTGGDGSFQVSVGMDRTLRLWDQRIGRATAVMSMQNEINYVSLAESQTNYNLQSLVKGTKRSLQFSNQGLAALAHSDGSISIWNLLQQKQMKVLKYHNMDCRCVEFDPTSRYLASASFDATVALYDLDSNRLISSIQDHTDRVGVLCKWHPFYPFVLSTSADQTARVFAPSGFVQQLIRSFNLGQ